jgi:hypothetical protein
MLITPAEVARESPAPHSFTTGPPSTRALTPGPEIVVEQPPVTAPPHPPISFRVRFVPEAGSTIDPRTFRATYDPRTFRATYPRTFRATYGMLGLDITARRLRHAKFTGEELFAENVDIPAGNHRVTIAIADTPGHESSRTFQFTVV